MAVMVFASVSTTTKKNLDFLFCCPCSSFCCLLSWLLLAVGCWLGIHNPCQGFLRRISKNGLIFILFLFYFSSISPFPLGGNFFKILSFLGKIPLVYLYLYRIQPTRLFKSQLPGLWGPKSGRTGGKGKGGQAYIDVQVCIYRYEEGAGFTAAAVHVTVGISIMQLQDGKTTPRFPSLAFTRLSLVPILVFFSPCVYLFFLCLSTPPDWVWRPGKAGYESGIAPRPV